MREGERVGEGGGLPMRGLGTDHVISGPIRGQKKNACDGMTTHDTQTDGYCDSKKN